MAKIPFIENENVSGLAVLNFGLKLLSLIFFIWK